MPATDPTLIVTNEADLDTALAATDVSGADATNAADTIGITGQVDPIDAEATRRELFAYVRNAGVDNPRIADPVAPGGNGASGGGGGAGLSGGPFVAAAAMATPGNLIFDAANRGFGGDVFVRPQGAPAIEGGGLAGASVAGVNPDIGRTMLGSASAAGSTAAGGHVDFAPVATSASVVGNGAHLPDAPAPNANTDVAPDNAVIPTGAANSSIDGGASLTAAMPAVTSFFAARRRRTPAPALRPATPTLRPVLQISRSMVARA